MATELKRDPKSYIETYTGKKFFPLQPLASEIDLLDMVHAVSLECRYGGHVKHMWSVAQHLLAVIHYLKFHGHSAYLQFLGGTHDLEESYLKDIPKPIKMHMPEYKAAGKVLQEMIWFDYFGIRRPTIEEIEILEEADRSVLYYEALALNINKTNWIPDMPSYHYEFEECLPSVVETALLSQINGLLAEAKRG